MGGRKPLLPMVNDLFHQINDDFNGDIFKPHPCEEIKLTDQALHRIIKELYPPQSPYRFDVIPVDIFGAVYERYLGKTIHVRGKDVEVEDKPEVRKAGGVYYTPKYIVDYIVKNTVGKVIEGKTPKQIEKIRILDPACGSGSFLLGAFQYLIDYHVAWYEKHPKQARVHPLYPDLVKSNGVPRLSIWRKAKILHNNLFGVDLDPQAVEITMMNLYLKALENERDLPQKQHLLPELGRNIRCGNSLIAPDITKEQKLSPEELDRLNPLDWASKTDGFGDILGAAEGPERSRGSGFDAVIGNPPYGADYTPREKHYFQSKYVYRKGKPETYIFFLEQGIEVLKHGGMLGFITPNAWLTNYYGVQLRRFVLEHCLLENIVDLEPTKVFQKAVVDTVITVLAKSISSKHTHKTKVWQGTKDHKIVPQFENLQAHWEADPELIINVQASPSDLKLLRKVEASGQTVNQLVDYSQGVIPYKTKEQGRVNRYIAPKRKSKGWLPLVENASQVRRYELQESKAFIWYGDWLWCHREPRYFNQTKILFHRLRKKLPRQLVGTLEQSGAVNRHSLSNLILRPGLSSKTLRFVLGIFNSTLANWWFVKRYGLLMEVAGFKVARLPLPSKWLDKQARIVALVDRMLELNKKKHSRRPSPAQLRRLERKIALMDKKIDELVYKLYGITEQERKIIEGT